MAPMRERTLPPLALAMAGGVAFAYLASLFTMAIHHRWILDEAGRPLTTDFVSFWTAGRLALFGHGAEAYDWARMHAIQQNLMAHDPGGFLGWAYPPLFFLPTLLLAAMPYGIAFLAWVAATMALYLAIVARAAQTRSAVLLALAAPPTLACALVGQNGFLTAALMGGVLLALEKRPLVAGLLLGLLTYKPHFGLLFPVALVFGGHGRAFLAAAVMSVLIVLLSWLLAPASLLAFVTHLSGMSRDFLSHGQAGFFKLQSLYGLLRLSGLADAPAFAAQGFLLLAMAGFTAWLWRSDAPFWRRCAGLAAATLLATPYLFFYDLPILTLAIAFLWRERPFDRLETALLVAAQLALALFVSVSLPVGLAASALTLAVILRRWVKDAATGLRLQPA